MTVCLAMHCVRRTGLKKATEDVKTAEDVKTKTAEID